jgi:hypothetical protein
MPDLGWLKSLIAPAAKAHSSRKISAVAVVAGAISVLRFVLPVDGAARCCDGSSLSQEFADLRG